MTPASSHRRTERACTAASVTLRLADAAALCRHPWASDGDTAGAREVWAWLQLVAQGPARVIVEAVASGDDFRAAAAKVGVGVPMAQHLWRDGITAIVAGLNGA